MNPRPRLTRPLGFILLLQLPLLAQLPPLPWDEGALGLAFALRKLPQTGRLMHTAAHPDDEDNGLLVFMGRGRGLQTALLTLTRGDGGQNEIGPELFDAIGILRTEELLALHRYDGARQYFSRASDFGYSFSVQETLERWGREEILRDMVRVIRTFRPHVIVSLPRTGKGGGQHHQASALLTAEAFRAAGDPHRFPELDLQPWQPLKLYERYAWEGSARGQEPEPPDVLVDKGGFEPLLGQTYQQIGIESRSMHKCQGMAQLRALPGPGSSAWNLVDSTIPVKGRETDLFDGIDTSLLAIAACAGDPSSAGRIRRELVKIARTIEAAEDAYDARDTRPTVPPLARGLKLVRRLRESVAAGVLPEAEKFQIDFMLRDKETDFAVALRLAHQLTLDALAEDGLVIPGQSLTVRATLANGASAPLAVRRLGIDAPPGWQAKPSAAPPRAIPAGGAVEAVFELRVSSGAEPSRPYWHKNPQDDIYQLSTPEHFGLPWSPSPATLRAEFDVDGTPLIVERPVQFRYQGPWVGGEQRHELMVVPKISLRVEPQIAILPLARIEAGREVRVRATYHGKDPARGSIHLQLPDGWRSDQDGRAVSFEREDESVTRRFRLFPPAISGAGREQIGVEARLQGESYREGYQVIDYDHIQRRHLYRPARIEARLVDVAVRPGSKLGYVVGVGDEVPAALDQLGLDFETLDEDDLAFGDLSRFDVIMTGVRAYLNRSDLKTHNARLLEWVESGGVLIVNYNKFEFNRAAVVDGRREMQDSPWAPYPAQVGRARVTDERARVAILDPAHPLFTTPNRIGEADWEGWVQERGLYFLGEKDGRYRDLISMEDPFEYNPGEKLGALVVVEYGRGKWIYLGLGLWRQLPAGVPGAYRLLANLISLQ